jgi:hypothetical protein
MFDLGVTHRHQAAVIAPAMVVGARAASTPRQQVITRIHTRKPGAVIQQAVTVNLPSFDSGPARWWSP